MIGGGGGRGGGGTGRLYKALVDSKKALTVRMDYRGTARSGIRHRARRRSSKDQSLDDARKTMLDTIAAVATEPPTNEEVERAKTQNPAGHGNAAWPTRSRRRSD